MQKARDAKSLGLAADVIAGTVREHVVTARGANHGAIRLRRQARQLLRTESARARRRSFLHDENLDVYAMQRTTGEVRHIERRAFRHWLTATYYDTAAKAPRAQSVAEAFMTLAGIGRHKTGLVEVNVRCARFTDHYVIDLDEHGNSCAIRVRTGAWKVFIRPESMLPLSSPIHGGDLNELWGIGNVPERSRLLVLTWLLDSLWSDTPFPLLEVVGEQRSVKSVTQTVLRPLYAAAAITDGLRGDAITGHWFP
jgi:hypothetical protein